MRNGFDAPPASLLKKYLAIEMKDPGFVPGALAVLEGTIRELETLYSRE